MDEDSSSINPDIQFESTPSATSNTTTGFNVLTPNSQDPVDGGGIVQITQNGQKGITGAYVHCN